jgi:hypothetical protein
MRKFLRGLLCSSLIAICFTVSAQRPTVKFGDIKPEDFTPTAYAVDSSASAVVLYDVGSSKYEGDTHGGFSILFKRHTRIRLLNRNSFDLASISIPLYASGSLEEKIENLEATTYNVENGKVVSYKFDKNAIFKDRLNKNYTVRKFTFPNVKEGSIIEIKYTLNSPYERDLRTWFFQGDYPVQWSEYSVTIPSVYDFAFIKQGYTPLVVDEASTGNEVYNIILSASTTRANQAVNFPTTTVSHTWAMKDVPTLKKESFTTSLDNHISKVEFQLSKIRFPDTEVKNVMSDWYTLSKNLMENPDFGGSLLKGNGWLKDELKNITASATTPMEKAKKIFEFVRDNMSCTNSSSIRLSNPIRKVYQTKNGNVADINLLLTAFLLNSGLTAHPVLLSTRENGKAMEMYPILDKLNYVISEVVIDDKPYLLDASQNKLGFGKLTQECYNGYARVVDERLPILVNLSADSIRENKLTRVIIKNDEKNGLNGSFNSVLGDYESQNLREILVKKSKEDYFKDIKKEYSFDVDLTDANIDSLKVYEEPVTINYNFKFNAEDDLIYLNPIFGEAYKENPFKSAERNYPVEMPYTITENYILYMDIPKGYAVEEIPKSSRVNFNENEGFFEYLISKTEGAIQLRSTVKFNKATFFPEDYQSLRDFFGYIVKKHSEQIVLKKIK